MVNSFAELRNTNRQKNLDRLSQQLADASSSKKGFQDPRYWKCTVDAAGNGNAIIRFLPPSQGEDCPWVQIWSHGFKGPTGLYYIDKSLTTIGKNDPVGEYNSKLWAKGTEDSKQQARNQKRKLEFHSNILVIKDPGKPENEGKVFLFQYGKKIFDKINRLANPGIEGIPRVDAFDLVTGADFHLIQCKVDKWPNYDQSQFGPQRPLFVKGDTTEPDFDRMEKVWTTQYKLQPLIDPKEFSSYDVLLAKFNKVMGFNQLPPNDEDEKEPPFEPDMPEPSIDEIMKGSGGDEVDDVSQKYFQDIADRA